MNFLPGVGEEVGPILVGHPDVAMVAFTGSRGRPGDRAAGGGDAGGQEHVSRA